MQIKLKYWREKRGLTRQQLSEKADVSRTYISEIETGAYTNVGIIVLCKLCKALECTLNDMVNCNDKEIK